MQHAVYICNYIIVCNLCVNMNVVSFFICAIVVEDRDNSMMFNICGTYVHMYIHAFIYTYIHTYIHT